MNEQSIDIKKLIHKVIEDMGDIKYRMVEDIHVDSLLVGIPEVDFELMGIFPGEIAIFVGAENDLTSIAAKRVALGASNSGKKVLYFTGNNLQLDGYSFLSIASGVSDRGLRNLNWQDTDIRQVGSATKDFDKNNNLDIEAIGRKTARDIHDQVRKMYLEGLKVGCVVIDSLQMLNFINEAESKNGAPDTGREIKRMASELNIPIILTSCLSRNYIMNERSLSFSEGIYLYTSLVGLADKVIGLKREKEKDLIKFFIDKNNGLREGSLEINSEKFMKMEEDLQCRNVNLLSDRSAIGNFSIRNSVVDKLRRQ